jgi:hypothetical protein
VPDNGGVRAGLNSTGSTIATHRLVKRSTAVDTIAPETDGTAASIGVTMAAITDGYAGDVQVEGRAIVEAGAAIAIGAKVMGGTGGKGATATAAKWFIGIANTEALVDGDLIEVDIQPGIMPA